MFLLMEICYNSNWINKISARNFQEDRTIYVWSKNLPRKRSTQHHSLPLCVITGKYKNFFDQVHSSPSIHSRMVGNAVWFLRFSRDRVHSSAQGYILAADKSTPDPRNRTQTCCSSTAVFLKERKADHLFSLQSLTLTAMAEAKYMK